MHNIFPLKYEVRYYYNIDEISQILSQTCIKMLPLGQRKGDLLRQDDLLLQYENFHSRTRNDDI